MLAQLEQRVLPSRLAHRHQSLLDFFTSHRLGNRASTDAEIFQQHAGVGSVVELATGNRHVAGSFSSGLDQNHRQSGELAHRQSGELAGAVVGVAEVNDSIDRHSASKGASITDDGARKQGRKNAGAFACDQSGPFVGRPAGW